MLWRMWPFSIQIFSMVYGKLKPLIDGRNTRAMSFISFYIIVKCWTSNGPPQLLVSLFQCAYVKIFFWYITSMVFKNIKNGLWFYRSPNHFPKVEMLHNNILGVIEEIQFKVDIENVKEWHNPFEKALGFQIPMPSDDSTMVVHIGSTLLISKHIKSGT